MMLYYREKSKYTVKCPKCDDLLKINIDLNNFKIIGHCKKDHYFNDILFNNFENDYIKNTDLFRSKNGELEPGEKESNYTCHKCKKSFCCTCKDNNDKKSNNPITIHDLKYDYFYNNSKIFLCQDCIKLYQYEGEKEKKINNKIIEYIEKNTKLLEYIKKLRKEFEDRQNKLYQYLNFLNKVNDLLLNHSPYLKILNIDIIYFVYLQILF
jgi:hypothetical protein